MFHLRPTVGLKDIFQRQLKRRLAGGVHAPLAAGYWSRSPATATEQHAARRFCSKADGHNDANKDSATDK